MRAKKSGPCANSPTGTRESRDNLQEWRDGRGRCADTGQEYCLPGRRLLGREAVLFGRLLTRLKPKKGLQRLEDFLEVPQAFGVPLTAG